MANCDVCNVNLSTDFKRYSSHDFNNIVKKGFNPFKENITYPTGLKLSEMGAAMGLSVDQQYSQWKINALRDNSDWILCPQCSPYADRFKY